MKGDQIREKGKTRFVLQFSLGISIPLLIDYYIIKFLLHSFEMDFVFAEGLIAWIICLLVGGIRQVCLGEFGEGQRIIGPIPCQGLFQRMIKSLMSSTYQLLL
ncbi:hypothetical protein B14911_03864 [Bacillus sp. NRRL B-14911]|uniref:Uncharacterized protein n=1 Tax=Bacillus infantis NRRL B-14911 TaxID=1367477 RepID=U5LIC8_9BACI|nr:MULTISPECIES: hypothetical protein [Bacillus]AGX06382.1 hypothetical protein N288_22715 [Bacillus infantis NRRL B-14911]EAR68689.1 hypothetical protein B14911_03864 [Bacillus sp. NRRL B-14911]